MQEEARRRRPSRERLTGPPGRDPAASSGGNGSELLEMLDMESEGLRVSWNQHGDRSIAKRLGKSDCPLRQAIGAGGRSMQTIETCLGTNSGPSAPMRPSVTYAAQQTEAATDVTKANARLARLSTVQDECASLDLQAKAWRNTPH